MAAHNVASQRRIDKPTFVYGLIDPRTQEIRYIGKSVLSPARRLAVHLWRAKTAPKKRHSMAWLLGLHRAAMTADVETLEVVPPGGDWVEAEQFWISSFRLAGADLCNHTDGGEGQTGYKQPPEMIAKRIKRGAEHHRTGVPMPMQTREALRLGNELSRADPARLRVRLEKQRAGMTPAMLAAATARLLEINADPERHRVREENRVVAVRTPAARKRVADWSRRNWAENRDKTIAGLVASKNRPEVKAKMSAATRAAWANPNSRNHGAWRDRKLSDDDVIAIRQMLSGGEKVGALAARYGVSQSLISLIKSKRRRV